jgi:hypothetical protein
MIKRLLLIPFLFLFIGANAQLLKLQSKDSLNGKTQETILHYRLD